MFENFFKKENEKLVNFSWKRVWLIITIFVVMVGVFFVASFVYVDSYKEKVLPGVYLGGIHIGGMDKENLTTYIQSMNTKLLNKGILFNFSFEGEEKKFTVYPSVLAKEETRDLIDLDIQKEVDSLIYYRKNDNFLSDIFSAVLVRIQKPTLNLETVKIDKNELFIQIQNFLKDYIKEPKNATIKITTLDPLKYELVSSTSGYSFDYEMVAGKILKSWSNLETPNIDIVSHAKDAEIKEEDVKLMTDKLSKIFDGGPLNISYIDKFTTKKYNWVITTKMISDWLEVQKNNEGNLSFGLNFASTTEFFLKEIEPNVNIKAQDAKFQIGANGKVNEFVGSRPGATVDTEATLEKVKEAFDSRILHLDAVVKNVDLVIKETKPNIKTGEVNDLGISEIIGVGQSRFKGSPTNRIKNIKHAIYDKLNGLLIKPNEDFSLVNALRPFTVADGYLPELVIKGDEIKPEVAGGLCQVGTTMFRAAMNSGLKITARRNHSLVVSYYNDLSNGNPGTDATIYDPNPDFRFLNDTGNYILVTTEMNTQTGDLFIYLWGTNDGRKASYSPPVVSKWIPTGPVKNIETTNLAPGKKECQESHVGAQTSFTYTRVLADGKKENVVFDSYYRPLPKICLVGVEPKVEATIPSTEEIPNTTEEITAEVPVLEENQLPFDLNDPVLN
ncbi:MAG: VanW family protein [Candidatus Magasanikbacteria bacterium]